MRKKSFKTFLCHFSFYGSTKKVFFLLLLYGYTALFIGVFFKTEDVCIVLVVGHIFNAEKKL